jgi:hypothetical protein
MFVRQISLLPVSLRSRTLSSRGLACERPPWLGNKYRIDTACKGGRGAIQVIANSQPMRSVCGLRLVQIPVAASIRNIYLGSGGATGRHIDYRFQWRSYLLHTHTCTTNFFRAAFDGHHRPPLPAVLIFSSPTAIDSSKVSETSQ